MGEVAVPLLLLGEMDPDWCYWVDTTPQQTWGAVLGTWTPCPCSPASS